MKVKILKEVDNVWKPKLPKLNETNSLGTRDQLVTIFVVRNAKIILTKCFG